MEVDTAALEHAIDEIVDVSTAIEVDGDSLVVTGIIDTPEERQAILDVLGELEPYARIVDNLAMTSGIPAELAGLELSEADSGGFRGAEPGLQDPESIEPGDFTDQRVLKDQGAASGPSGTHADDDVAEGGEVYIPPTDPVRTPDGEILGGFQTTADEDDAPSASAVTPGSPDGAIEEAVRLELLQDAATTAMEVDVACNQGVVTLRGIVDDLDDAESAQAVAARVPGVLDVVDELQIRAGRP